MRKDEQVANGNYSIAKFDDYLNRNQNPSIEYTDDEWLLKIADSMEYHSSWQWLMPVVDKIEKIGASVFIQNDACWIKPNFLKPKFTISNLSDNSKIEAVWLSVIEFINWYNEHKLVQ